MKKFILLLIIPFLSFGQTETKKEYYQNGQLKNETNYKDGKLDGYYKWYTRDVILEGLYKEGRKQGYQKVTFLDNEEVIEKEFELSEHTKWVFDIDFFAKQPTICNCADYELFLQEGRRYLMKTNHWSGNQAKRTLEGQILSVTAWVLQDYCSDLFGYHYYDKYTHCKSFQQMKFIDDEIDTNQINHW